MTSSFRGTGTGVITEDGCPVEVYRRLPYLRELESIRGELPAGVSVLELGCGTGRLTRRLLELGAIPTCIDNTPEMLASLPEGVEAILADMRTLRLNRKFDRVLLANGFINNSDDAFIRQVLETCAMHTKDEGRLLVERFDPDWLLNTTEGPLGHAGSVENFVGGISREGDRVALTLRYVDGGSEWSQSISVLAHREAEIEAMLARHAYRSFTWTPRGRWVSAGLG